MPAKAMNTFEYEDGKCYLVITSDKTGINKFLIDPEYQPAIKLVTWYWNKSLQRVTATRNYKITYLSQFVAGIKYPNVDAKRIMMADPYDYRVDRLFFTGKPS